jgi:hypothetical protein
VRESDGDTAIEVEIDESSLGNLYVGTEVGTDI